MTRPRDRVPLQILICDTDNEAVRIAKQAFADNTSVAEVQVALSANINETLSPLEFSVEGE